MTYRVYYHDHTRLFRCFVETAHVVYPKEQFQDPLQKALEPFCAKYVDSTVDNYVRDDNHGISPYIEFPDERYYSMFLLKYTYPIG